jgi:hypothetical protein
VLVITSMTVDADNASAAPFDKASVAAEFDEGKLSVWFRAVTSMRLTLALLGSSSMPTTTLARTAILLGTVNVAVTADVRWVVGADIRGLSGPVEIVSRPG